MKFSVPDLSFNFEDPEFKSLRNFSTKHSLTMAWFLSPSDGSNTILSNITWTQTSSFEHRTYSNVFFNWWSYSNTLILALDKRTSNIEPKRPLLNYSSNRLERHFLNNKPTWTFHLFSNTLFLASNDQTSNFEHNLTHHNWVPYWDCGLRIWDLELGWEILGSSNSNS